MSAKGRAAEGYVADPTGFFATQPQVVRALLPFLGIEPGMRILEPSCGNGAIGKVLREEYGESIYIVGVEIDKKRAGKAYRAKAYWSGMVDGVETEECLPVFNEVAHSDFYECSPEGLGAPFDIIATNPSFSIWLPFAEHCFKFGPSTTLLLPFNSMASKKRAQWWREHPAHMRVLSKRPSFAISVKCVASTNEGRKLGLARCEFQKLIALDAKVPKACPECDERIITTSSDSSEYCWATWGPDITRGLWDVIDTPACRVLFRAWWQESSCRQQRMR
jgi:hypothetical protein